MLKSLFKQTISKKNFSNLFSFHFQRHSPLCVQTWVNSSRVFCPHVPHHQCDQIWQNFATLANVNKYLANVWQFILFGKMLSIFWQICDIIGLIFIAANGQILKNILTIWSHCATTHHQLSQCQRKPFTAL